jgi:hypothetical protein
VRQSLNAARLLRVLVFVGKPCRRGTFCVPPFLLDARAIAAVLMDKARGKDVPYIMSKN